MIINFASNKVGFIVIINPIYVPLPIGHDSPLRKGL